EIKKNITEEEKQLKKLKRHASSQQKSQIKKSKALNDNYNNEVKPLWIIIVDGEPDKKPHYLKNVNQYCKLFRFLDLDYLIVRTYALEQSVYNFVKKSIITLS
ncbi:16997_t:CDS:2, partial [Cetraspora pellucida]